jgi:hypothetical protein
MASPTRREFVQSCAVAAALGTSGMMSFGSDEPRASNEGFASYQERRRRELWSLLGDLPWPHRASPPKVLKTEKHDGYTLERLVLDPNGIEPVPAFLLIPDKRPITCSGSPLHPLARRDVWTRQGTTPAWC